MSNDALKGMFAGMKDGARKPVHSVPVKKPSVSVRASAPEPAAKEQLAIQGTGKRSHPDFEKVTVYIRKKTHRTTGRLYQDRTGSKDFSDCVQMLLEKYEDAGGDL